MVTVQCLRSHVIKTHKIFDIRVWISIIFRVLYDS